jgi:hypothetical protein
MDVAKVISLGLGGLCGYPLRTEKTSFKNADIGARALIAVLGQEKEKQPFP